MGLQSHEVVEACCYSNILKIFEPRHIGELN